MPQDSVKAGNVSGGLYGADERGAWFYGNGIAAVAKGFAPDSATILMIRQGASGVSGTVTYQGHGNTASPGGTSTTQVTYVGSSQVTAASLTGTDSSITETLPAGMLTNIGNGTLKGFGLMVGGGTPKVLMGTNENVFSGLITLVYS